MPVRAASVWRQISERAERKPLSAPSVNGELANSAVIDRLQRQADAQLGDHVGFVGEIEIGLRGRGAEHHVEAARPDLGHVARHDAVAALRHDRRFGERPFRAHAEREEADPERLGDRVGAVQMRVEFGGDGVDGRLRRAGKLELAARLERDRAAAGRVERPISAPSSSIALPAERARACLPAGRRRRARPRRGRASDPAV